MSREHDSGQGDRCRRGHRPSDTAGSMVVQLAIPLVNQSWALTCQFGSVPSMDQHLNSGCVRSGQPVQLHSFGRARTKGEPPAPGPRLENMPITSGSMASASGCGEGILAGINEQTEAAACRRQEPLSLLEVGRHIRFGDPSPLPRT